jgi:nucleoside 2-deoxyribosyltransferase
VKVYLAARYSRRLELCGHAAEIEAAGHTVTSRWLLGNHQAENDQLHRGAEAERFALEDLDDLESADVMITFGEEPRTTTSRGGRHVEFGYALALGKSILLVGPREHVFACRVPQVQTFAEAMAWLAGALVVR